MVFSKYFQGKNRCQIHKTDKKNPIQTGIELDLLQWANPLET